MVNRHFLGRVATIFLCMIIFSACSPPTGLPAGPTSIPTLIPLQEQSAESEPSGELSFALQSYPASPPSAQSGAELYADLCLECHGPNGTGIVPGARDFRDLDFIRGETPVDFYSAVTEGRNEMPAYKDSLSSDARWDVVFYIWRLSTSSDVIESGHQLYTANCAPCHGEDGSGELLGSADFTNLREMDSLAPRDLYLTVTQGRGSMPAWQSLLSQDERWAVIDYVRTFTYDPTLIAGSEPTGEHPPSEDQVGDASCTPSTNPFGWQDPVAAQAGAALYEPQCAACHGTDGGGGLPNTPDFTAAQVQDDLRANTSDYFCILAEGTGAMPGFRRTLTDEEMWQVIVFLGSLVP